MSPVDGSHRSNNERRTATALLLAKFSLFWESLWPKIQPLLGVLALFLIVSWLGVWTLVPDWLRYIALAAFALAALFSLTFLRQIRWPDTALARARVEAVSKTHHRPLTAQTDRLANAEADDPLAAALFQAHRERMQAELSNLKSGTPKPRLEKIDSWGIRAIPVLLLVAAFAYGGSDRIDRIGDAFSPREPVVAAVELRVDAWINPPAYTRRAPLFLSSLDATEATEISMPENSAILVQIAGTTDEATLELDSPSGVRTIPIRSSSALSSPASRTSESDDDQILLTENTTARLLLGEELLNEWVVAIIPDRAPQIGFDDVPSVESNGAFQFSFEVEDDYGVTKAEAAFSLKEDIGTEHGLYDLPRFDLPVSRRAARSGSSKTSKNLTEHPYAGSAVAMSLLAEDAAGNRGESAAHEFRLPTRRFNDELARALVSERRKLALDKRTARRTANVLEALTTAPELFFEGQYAAYISIQIATRRLLDARSDDDLRSVVDLLWDTALGIEDGNVSLAAERLRQAQENLAEALEREADAEEIQQLMAELREAMNEFMQAMRENMEGMEFNENMAQDPNAQMLTEQDIQDMMDRIEELAQNGAEEAARELLSQLQQMMDNLQTAQPGQQNQGEGQNSEMNEAMDKLADIIQQQQALRDETFSREQELSEAEQELRQALRDLERERQRSQNQQSEGGQNQQQQDQQNQQGENGESQSAQNQQSAEERLEQLREALRQLQEQQEGIQQQLEELMGQMEGMGLEPEQGFGEAEGAMGEAGERLGEGQAGSAVGEQGRALDALREGAQGMMQQMMDMMAGQQPGQGNPQAQPGGQQPGQQQQGRNAPNGRDPLGRQRGQQDDGLVNEGILSTDGEGEIKRSREIQREIMRRLEEQNLAPRDKQYLEDLLERD